MKILIVMGGFFPGKKYGGPPVSVDNFCSLMKDHECFVITRDHDLGENERYDSISEGWNDRYNCKVCYVSDKDYVKSTFDKVINEVQPDLIYLQGVFQKCILPCLRLSKIHKIPILLAPRGELCTGALRIKKNKKIIYITVIKALGLVRNIHWQSTSTEETEAIKKWMKSDDEHVHFLDNIPSIYKKKNIRSEKIKGKARLIFLSRIHPKKNLISAIRFLNGVSNIINLDIYGPIENREYWEKCQEEINKLEQNIVVNYNGIIAHNQVHEIISRYDAFLFPTISENYGHVIAESILSDCPVIISKGTTPWDDIDGNGGFTIPLDDIQGWSAIIDKIASMDQSTYTGLLIKLNEYKFKKFNISKLKNKYYQVFNRIIGE